MTTTSSRFFDEIAKLMNSAAGAAQGVRREVDTLVKAQVERVLNELNVVQREEFEAVKEMAARAREENDRLRARLDEVDAMLRGQSPEGTRSATRPSAAPPPFPTNELGTPEGSGETRQTPI